MSDNGSLAAVRRALGGRDQPGHRQRRDRGRPGGRRGGRRARQRPFRLHAAAAAAIRARWCARLGPQPRRSRESAPSRWTCGFPRARRTRTGAPTPSGRARAAPSPSPRRGATDPPDNRAARFPVSLRRADCNRDPSPAPTPRPGVLAGVGRVVAISSGKGGVGKVHGGDQPGRARGVAGSGRRTDGRGHLRAQHPPSCSARSAVRR